MRFSVTQVGYTIEAEVKMIGKDLLITVIGGNVPHIGAVTTLTNKTDISTIKYPSHDGRYHKDGILGERIAQIIQPILPGSCTITAGVHVDHISQKQILASDKMAQQLGTKINRWIKQQNFSSQEPIYYSKNEKPI